jgi:8-oxo-dGTP pyrophosphatase MutT (NUDIX family)
MMQIAIDTAATVADYVRRFPGEANRFALLMRQMTAGQNVFVRSNMTGHVTCSSLILNEDSTKILVIEHALLMKVLQPGGHYESGSLWDNALREGCEETGADVALHEWSTTNRIPIDIDSHAIPANPKKGEAEHFHHDFMYLARAAERQKLAPQLAEVHSAGWITVPEWADNPDARIQRVMSKLCTFGLVNEPTSGSRPPASALRRRKP